MPREGKPPKKVRESMSYNRPERRSTKGIVTLVFGLLLAAFLLARQYIPVSYGFALVVESVMPWFGVLIIPLFLIALFRWSIVAFAGALIPAVVWASLFGAQMLPERDSTSAEADLTVATQNIGARLPQPTAMSQRLIEADADIVTVQELESESGEIIVENLDDAYPYRQVVDTVGVWSKYPLSEATTVDLGLGWPRAFQTTVDTDAGAVSFYAVHMPSVRPGSEATRNEALRMLSEDLAADDAERIVLAGDLNTASTDRNFDVLEDQLTDTRVAVRGGFGFTWPSVFPVTRLSHIMVRGFTPLTDEVMERGTSDHRAIEASLAEDA